jgi:hypothetical protein
MDSSTLINVSYKMLTVILLKQLVQYIKEILSDNQSGFRRRRENIYYLFELSLKMEEADELGIDFPLSFISFKQANGTMEIKYLYKILREFDLSK